VRLGLQHRHRLGQAGHRGAHWVARQAVRSLLARRRQELDALRIQSKGKGTGSIVVNADGTVFLWAPKDGVVVYSKDRGATWARAEGLPESDPDPDWAPVHFRPAADRVNAQKFYVLDAKGGQAYASVDGGAHFTASPMGLPSLADYQLNSASAQATPGVEGDVWLTNLKELNHSTDSGKSSRPCGRDRGEQIGFGKPADGKKYPALYLMGKVGEVRGSSAPTTPVPTG